jgi:hypothetical protein
MGVMMAARRRRALAARFRIQGERDSAPADDRARVVDLGHKVRSAATDGVMVNHEATDGELLLKGDAAAFAGF